MAKTREEREKLVRIASGLAGADGHTGNNDFLKPYIEGEKTIDEIIEDILSKYKED